VWLGKFSPKEKIRQSGLWLVNELYGGPLSRGDFNYLQSLESHIINERTMRNDQHRYLNDLRTILGLKLNGSLQLFEYPGEIIPAVE
jgi:hypothetical protein